MTGLIPGYPAFRARQHARHAQLRRLAAPGQGSGGFVERRTALGDRERLEGWADADLVRIVDADGRTLAEAAPTLPRPDVQARLAGGHDGYGFDLTVPAGVGAGVELSRNGVSARTPLNASGARQTLLVETRVLSDYLRRAATAVPHLAGWLLRRDPSALRRLQRHFGTDDQTIGALAVGALRGQGWPQAGAGDAITIILPVYQGHDLIDPVLTRVVQNTDLPWHLVVLDDASPDPRIRPLLARWLDRIGAQRMTLLDNPVNLGFVGTVNRGLTVAAARGEDAVLLNSDAFVPAGWASRLLAPLRAADDVASVTPMSNDAEIANVPVICAPSSLNPGEADDVDRMAARLDGPSAVAEAPTGVGFCMAMARRALAQVPQFDPAFGIGYGEEVDWCQRTARAGWRHLLTAGLFVEHRGGQSFGSAVKAERIAANGRILSQRYPRFDAEVAGFIAADPLLTPRLALGLTLALTRARARGRRLSVMIGHGWAGGARVYLDQRVGREVDEAGGAVVLRAMPSGLWHVELHTAGGITAGSLSRVDDILRLWDADAPLRVVYSCAVGTPDPLAVPRLLVALSAGAGSTLEITFNDFYPISPSYTLVGTDGVFRGVPAPDDPDPAHRFTPPAGPAIALTDWRAAWDRAAARADQLTVFSASSAAIVATTWPSLRARISVEPHVLPATVPRLVPVPGPQPVIGVLGNLNAAKGAHVLADLSAELARTNAGRVVLLGDLAPGYTLTAPSLVAGPYTIEDLPDLVHRHRIDRWFFPSVWPETFSYVIHEMLRTGLPVTCFDLGGQGDAVRAAAAQGNPCARLLPLDTGGPDIPALAAALTRAPA